jgi:hypothetical protein
MRVWQFWAAVVQHVGVLWTFTQCLQQLCRLEFNWSLTKRIKRRQPQSTPMWMTSYRCRRRLRERRCSTSRSKWFPARPASRPWTPADDAQLLALLASGLDSPSIARKLQRCVQAIANRKSNLKQQAPLLGMDVPWHLERQFMQHLRAGGWLKGGRLGPTATSGLSDRDAHTHAGRLLIAAM